MFILNFKSSLLSSSSWFVCHPVLESLRPMSCKENAKDDENCFLNEINANGGWFLVRGFYCLTFCQNENWMWCCNGLRPRLGLGLGTNQRTELLSHDLTRPIRGSGLWDGIV